MTIGPAATVSTLVVDGPLGVTVLRTRESPDTEGVELIELADGADLALEIANKKLIAEVGLTPSSAHASVTTTGDVRLNVTATDGKGRLTLDNRRGSCHVWADPVEHLLDDLPQLHLVRGTFTISGDHRHVHCGDTTDVSGRHVNVPAHRPMLDVTTDGFVDRISGEFALRSSDGRLVGRIPTREPRWGRQSPTSDSLDQPAVMLDLSRFEEDGGPLRGTLVHVDVSQLQFTELQRLKELHVFSPLPAPLRDLAQESGPRTSLHDTAQRLATISELTGKRAVSGRVRSWALWASTRAHHRTTTHTEQAARWLHRAVGYGQRPLPAGLTFLATLLATAAVLTVAEPASCHDPTLDEGQQPDFQHGPYAVGEQFLRVLLVPLSLVRLTATEGQGYAPIFCHPLGQLTVTIVVGLPLVYLLIATRNYLRSPAD